MSELIANASARFKQAERNNNYLEWLALSAFYSSLASEAAADKSMTIAEDLNKCANDAKRRAIDMEPKREAA